MNRRQLVALLGGDVVARAVVDAFASRPRKPLYDFGGEAESSIEQSGESRRLHAAYALGDALDVAGRVFPNRKVVDRVRAVAQDGRDVATLAGLVGVVLGGERRRAKLYLTRGEALEDSAMRTLASDVARALALPEPALPELGRCDVVAIENEPTGAVALKAYLSFDDVASALPLVSDAGDRERLTHMAASAARQPGRCPVMVTVKLGRPTAAQIQIDPAGLGDLPYAPRCPAGMRPTYVSIGLGTNGVGATTYFLLPGAPLCPPSPRAGAPRVETERSESKAIDVSIGEHCDNDCKFCINPTESRAPLASLAQMKQVISRCGADGYRRLSFLGGEPTLHPEIVEIVEHAYREGFEEVLLVTNGRRFADGKFSERVYRAGVRRALFMFVSHRPDVHDQVTRRPGSHDEAVRGLDRAMQLGIEVGVNVPVMRPNVEHLADVGEFFAARGVRSLAYLYLAAYGNVLSNPSVMADYDVAARSLAEACERLGSRLELHIDNFPFCLLPGNERYILREVENPRRKVAYPTGGVNDVGSYFRFRRRRLRECDDCRWDRACGGLQELDEPGQLTPLA